MELWLSSDVAPYRDFYSRDAKCTFILHIVLDMALPKSP